MPLTLIRFHTAGKPWLADLTRPCVLSVRTGFGSESPVWFGAPAPTAKPLETGDFVGDVSRGGSVNVSVLGLTPHCTGTHTEGIGHLTGTPAPISEIAMPGLIPASLVSMAGGSRAEMERALAHREAGFHEALVVRAELPEGFEPDALRLARQGGVRHLIVEAVSVDPPDDGGLLLAHRAFFNLPAGAREGYSARTVTELARIPPGLHDGPWLLDLQLPDLDTDAVPSRPVLYPVAPADPADRRIH